MSSYILGSVGLNMYSWGRVVNFTHHLAQKVSELLLENYRIYALLSPYMGQ